MAESEAKLENRIVTIDAGGPKLNFYTARIREGLSQLGGARIEVFCDDPNLKLSELGGKKIAITYQEKDGVPYDYSGHCIAVCELEAWNKYRRLVLELRPWLWFLTLQSNNRIFQDKTAKEIIDEVLSEHGFSGSSTNSLSGTYKKRSYCVQFGETDFDFISRLMEEEGIYYFFFNDGKDLKMKFCDGVSAHSTVPGFGEIDYHHPDSGMGRSEPHIFGYQPEIQINTEKFSMREYDFETPDADTSFVSQIANDSSGVGYEQYLYPGRYRDPEASGDTRARYRTESEAAKRNLCSGMGNVPGFRVGSTFKLMNHEIQASNKEYLVVEVEHLLVQDQGTDTDRPKPVPGKDNSDIFENDEELGLHFYKNNFKIMPKTVPFRAPFVTPWPKMAGVQTAVVTGPSGEEIYTDKYGRIKVKFHWDRVGKNDEHSSCFVRCVMPWAGKEWGMISVPRIGQEVVIQFEDGDPDRPICTGMLYNSAYMPPYGLPANMTQTGIVTRSTKEGNSKSYNELIFEDLKDSEFVRLQSEKDYKETIKNNAEITIGVEKQDPGDLTQTIYHTKTETIQTGDDILNVETGNQTITVAGTHTETITGDTEQTIEQGNLTREVLQGNETVTVKLGDYSLEASAGQVTLEAATKMTLKVGASSITLTPDSISIDAVMITVNGEASVDVSSPATTVSGDGMLTLKGGVVMIN